VPSVGDRFDVPAALVALAESGYDGPVSVKPHRSTLPSVRSDSLIKTLAESLDQLFGAAGLAPDGKLEVTAESAGA
jgi:sugar phosphate isomerase/epimerase